MDPIGIVGENNKVRVNFRKNKSGKNEFLIDKISDEKDLSEVDPELGEQGGKSEAEVAINSFMSNTTNTINIYGFLNRLNNDSVDRTIDKDLRPHIQNNGERVEPAEGYTEAYDIDFDVFVEQQGFIRHISRALSTREALGPMFLLNVTAQYDVLVSDLIRIVLKKFPGILDSSERTFTLTDLKRIGTIEEAEKQLIDREVESVMYGSHKSQVEWFDKRTSGKIIPLLKSFPEFCEVFERRNLCAHTSLIVNDRYINNCKKFGIDEKMLPAKNTTVDVDFRYVNRASELLIQFGMIITQSIWKHICKKDKDELLLADKSLLYHARRTANSRRYKLAAILLEIGFKKLVPANDLNRKEMIISLADVLIRDKKSDSAKDLILEHDWTSSNTRMKIISSAIIGSYSEAIALMGLAKIENSIEPEDYSRLAIFREMAKDKDFRKEYQKTYGRDFNEVTKVNIIDNLPHSESVVEGGNDLAS